MYAPDKKRDAWHFGIKMYIGVDDKLGMIHSIKTTATNTHDIGPADQLLHRKEQRVFGDAGYLVIKKRTEHKYCSDVL